MSFTSTLYPCRAKAYLKVSAVAPLPAKALTATFDNDAVIRDCNCMQYCMCTSQGCKSGIHINCKSAMLK